jgi:hypothetical protein
MEQEESRNPDTRRWRVGHPEASYIVGEWLVKLVAAIPLLGTGKRRQFSGRDDRVGVSVDGAIGDLCGKSTARNGVVPRECEGRMYRTPMCRSYGRLLLLAGFGLGCDFGHFCGHGLIDFEVGHFQFA